MKCAIQEVTALMIYCTHLTCHRLILKQSASSVTGRNERKLSRMEIWYSNVTVRDDTHAHKHKHYKHTHNGVYYMYVVFFNVF